MMWSAFRSACCAVEAFKGVEDVQEIVTFHDDDGQGHRPDDVITGEDPDARASTPLYETTPQNATEADTLLNLQNMMKMFVTKSVVGFNVYLISWCNGMLRPKASAMFKLDRYLQIIQLFQRSEAGPHDAGTNIPGPTHCMIRSEHEHPVVRNAPVSLKEGKSDTRIGTARRVSLLKNLAGRACKRVSRGSRSGCDTQHLVEGGIQPFTDLAEGLPVTIHVKQVADVTKGVSIPSDASRIKAYEALQCVTIQTRDNNYFVLMFDCPDESDHFIKSMNILMFFTKRKQRALERNGQLTDS